MQRIGVIDVSGRPALGLACRGQIADLALALRLMRAGQDPKTTPSAPPARHLGAWVRRGPEAVAELEEVAGWLGRRPAVPVGDNLWHPLAGTPHVASIPSDGRIFCVGGRHGPLGPDETLSQVRIKGGGTTTGPQVDLGCRKPAGGFELQPRLGLVVGQTLTRARADAAHEAIMGIAMLLDCRAEVSRELVSADLAGSVDGSSPTGPWMAVGEGWEAVLLEPIRLSVDGEVVDREAPRWTPDDLGQTLAILSRWLTLVPGDVVAVPVCLLSDLTVAPRAEVEMVSPTLGNLRVRVVADAQ